MPPPWATSPPPPRFSSAAPVQFTHHPDESVLAGDIEIAIAVLNDFLKLLANQQNPLPPKNAVEAAAAGRKNRQTGVAFGWRAAIVRRSLEQGCALSRCANERQFPR